MVIVDGGQNPFGKNGIERDKEGGQDSGNGSSQGEIDFTSRTEEETKDDNGQAAQGPWRGGTSQEDIGENGAKDNRQGSRDVIERHLDPFETKIVEGNHSHKDQGQGKDTLSGQGFVISLGELRQKRGFLFSRRLAALFCFNRLVGRTTTLFSHFTGNVTNKGRHNTLKPRDKEGRRNGHDLARHEHFVEVDHTDTHEPVQRYHGSNVRVIMTHS